MADGLGLDARGGDEASAARNDGTLPRRSLVSRALSVIELYVIAAGLLSFSGYVLDVPRLTDWANTGISIQPNTALAATLAGVALLALRKRWLRVGTAAGISVSLIGSTVVLEHLTGRDFGIDQTFLFDRPWGRGGVTSPGRMGPAASTSWTLLGLAFILALRSQHANARRAATTLALLTGGLSLLGLVGYLYGASTLYSLPRSTVIALQTGTFIFAVSLGLVLNVHDHGPMRLLSSRSIGGNLARRSLPVIVLMPILVGLVRVHGERLGFYDSAFGTAARTLIETLILTLLVWSTAAALNQQASRRAEAERQREDLLDKERAARAEAERATRLKDEFLSTLSHELRTPLSAILGWTQILKKSPPADERIRNALEVIERNGRAQAKLISDLLDISRITAGTLELELATVDLATVAKNAVSSLLPAATGKGIELRLEAGARPLLLRGDPARLQQMIWNLLSNAVKFTPRGGRIELGLKQVGTTLEIRVEDSGQGIAPEFLPHLFERFRQADGSTARRHGGLGIGLSIVKQLAELHGGSIRAESAGHQRGATFVVELPRGDVEGPTSVRPEPPAERSAPDATRGARLAGARMLVVDDEPDALAVIGHLCRGEGASVTSAASAQGALELLDAQSFDVIVSDIAMPNGDGYDLMTAVRARGIVTPAVALTAFARDEDKQKALCAGFQAHVTKPVDHEVLLAALQPLLGAERRDEKALASDAPKAS
jgi:signal transduction histidine kinase/CheY-like chemotaxis protein